MSAKYPERFSNNTDIHIKNLKDLMPSNALKDWCRENHIHVRASARAASSLI